MLYMKKISSFSSLRLISKIEANYDKFVSKQMSPMGSFVNIKNFSTYDDRSEIKKTTNDPEF